MLGGKCVRCGWKMKSLEELSAYDFHHPNDDKIFSISKMGNKNWETIVDEIKKCDLLCANCHRVEHSKYDDARLIKIAIQPKDPTKNSKWT